ncbi:hypothetical protein [Streptomyces odontomachi]|nr:hypothetical protein [Streptomyces sp. ODS25]
MSVCTALTLASGPFLRAVNTAPPATVGYDDEFVPGSHADHRTTSRQC